MKQPLRTRQELLDCAQKFANSGQFRAAYAATLGIAVHTLDHYRRQVRPRPPQLLEVDWQPPSLPPAPDCAIILRNGRRIELSAACLSHLAGPGDLLQTLLSAADPH